MYTYLLINLLAVAIPLALSFERRVCYVKKWKSLFPAILIVGAGFIFWDYYFTKTGVWGFNSKYLVGWDVFGLPIEEVLFFFCIPFSCLFIYEVVGYYSKKEGLSKGGEAAVTTLIIFLLIVSFWNITKVYTFTTFLLLAVVLTALRHFIRPGYLGGFFRMYWISLIPFLIVNGLLTRGLRFIDPGPVVWYNNAENLSLRVMTIPVEDFAYSMLLLLLNTSLYEFFNISGNEKRC